jgi:hypothetical protein
MLQKWDKYLALLANDFNYPLTRSLRGMLAANKANSVFDVTLAEALRFAESGLSGKWNYDAVVRHHLTSDSNN